jgi:hypothetical protein
VIDIGTVLYKKVSVIVAVAQNSDRDGNGTLKREPSQDSFTTLKLEAKCVISLQFSFLKLNLHCVVPI